MVTNRIPPRSARKVASRGWVQALVVGVMFLLLCIAAASYILMTVSLD